MKNNTAQPGLLKETGSDDLNLRPKFLDEGRRLTFERTEQFCHIFAAPRAEPMERVVYQTNIGSLLAFAIGMRISILRQDEPSRNAFLPRQSPR